MPTTPLASSDSPHGGGLLDLEKELTCSICTEVLYQPLTLLDCLHTFCGSCLKEWFGWQRRSPHASNSRARTSPTYTCPSCRAEVRETRPNATVTTLLDMYIQVNPDRAKSEEEKQEIAKSYKPGENVIRAADSRATEGRNTDRRRTRSDEHGDDEADRRILDEVRELSLREVGVDSGTSREQSRNGDGRHRRRDRDRSGNSARSGEQRSTGNTRGLGHQSSLRSLLSTSDLESQEMEEEIMRQIMEEGLLDGIDLSAIDVNQEDEISERIAQAYRRRQRERQREETSRRTVPERGRDEVGRERSPRSGTEGPSPARVSRPPLSRPHLIDASSHGRQSQPRSSSHGSSSRSLRPEDAARSSAEISRPSNRSATDLSETIHSRESRNPRQRRLSSHDRRATDPETNRASDIWRRGAQGELGQNQERNQQPVPRSAPSPPGPAARQSIPSRAIESRAGDSSNSVPFQTASSPETAATTARVSPTAQVPITVRRPAPSLSCRSCSRQQIECGVHYICPKCSDATGPYVLCLRCYRLGRGCKNWYGFGSAAMAKFQRKAPAGGYPPSQEPPHVMRAERYQPPEPTDVDPIQTLGQLPDETSPILQQGVFCDLCHGNANGCYWRCDVCNDGEWGFCNNCLKKGHHCTHPLLPLAYDVPIHTSQDGQQNSAAVAPTLQPVPIRTTCNLCRLPIPPSHTRFHCPMCYEGDYDVCITCYTSLVAAGKIDTRNGHHGWRRCPEKGHRMLVVGFEDRGGRQRRVVVDGPVGGWALVDDDTTPAQDQPDAAPSDAAPASWVWHLEGGHAWKSKKRASDDALGRGPRQGGGDGLRMVALWTRLPDEGDEEGEIMFPRGAEVTEVVDVNADWCWGVYCASGGLFPGAFGRVVG